MVPADFTIYNFTINELDFDRKDKNHIMVLIESSQTIKIFIQNLNFNASFAFKSNCSFFSDEGTGQISNLMTVTLAVQPSYCPKSGRLEAIFNSIIVLPLNITQNKLVLNAKTYPSMQYVDSLEKFRVFILSHINDFIKLYKKDLEDMLNLRLKKMIYIPTKPNKEFSHVPCNLTDEDDIKNCPLAVPIKSVFDGYNKSDV